ncbi:hypothetical protein HYV57_03330 [Candidatus Peregrinibacteria bacterium]|nr:hypothetical protein [Candidatus Peregrinibacteria bacterium]
MKNEPYIYILGRKPLLSLAELLTQFPDKDILSIRPKTFVSKTKINDPQAFLNTLGGTIRVAKIFHKAQKKNVKSLEAEIPKWIPFLKKYFKDRFKSCDGKIRFAMNIYNIPHPREIFLKKLLNEVKRNLKETGLKVRFVNNNFKNVESVVTLKEKLISKKGCEINVIVGDKFFLFAETVAVQNVDKYSERDYGKPARDPRSGMLPPKLAQIMINLAKTNAKGQKNKIEYVYDPFGGTGTILMESALQGLHAIGSDIDKQAVQYSKKNIEWLKKVHKIGSKQKIKIATLDATKLTAKQLKENMSVKRLEKFAIVTEPFLGPPFFRFPLMEKLEEHMRFLDYLYTKFFEQMKEILPKGTIIIFVIPAFRDKTHDIRMGKTVEKICSLGYSVIDLIPDHVAKKYEIGKPETPSLLYDRKDQIVAREIYKFVKNT